MQTDRTPEGGHDPSTTFGNSDVWNACLVLVSMTAPYLPDQHWPQSAIGHHWPKFIDLVIKTSQSFEQWPEVVIYIEGAQKPAKVWNFGGAWVAILLTGHGESLVLHARGIAPADLRLEVVQDLGAEWGIDPQWPPETEPGGKLSNKSRWGSAQIHPDFLAIAPELRSSSGS